MKRRLAILFLGLGLLCALIVVLPIRPGQPPPRPSLLLAVGSKTLAAAALLLPLPLQDVRVTPVRTTPEAALRLLTHQDVGLALLPGALAAEHAHSLQILAVAAQRSDASLLWTVPRVFHWSDLAGEVLVDQGYDSTPLRLLLNAYHDAVRRPPDILPGDSSLALLHPPAFFWTAEPYASQLVYSGRFHRALLPGAELGPYPALVLVAAPVFLKAHPLLSEAVIAGLLQNLERLRRQAVPHLAYALRAFFPRVSPAALQSSLYLMRRLDLFPASPLPIPLFQRMSAVDPAGPWQAALATLSDRYAAEAWFHMDDFTAPSADVP